MKTSILTKKQTQVFQKEITYDGKPSIIIVTVRYDDECNNGHNTFSITGEIWYKRQWAAHLAGSERADCVTGGQIKDDIRKHFPKLRPYMKWHLTSSDGPMHYIANTLYWVKKGNLDYARSCAVWPDAELSDFTKEKLQERLAALMEAFKRDIEALGFTY
jgi:hypothetical protein